MTTKKKIVIIGAGPGGYVAAVRAAQLGASVTLIEKNAIGGTCLNVGCIPTKVLLHTADLLNELKSEAKRIGVITENTRLDWDALMKRKTQTVSRLSKGTLALVQGNGVRYMEGTAAIKTANVSNGGAALFPYQVEVSGQTGTECVEADAIVIATGSVPDVPDIPGYDLDGVITSDEALSLPSPPKSMLISGGGIIGMEFAAAYASFGTKVTVAVTSPEILRNLDSDIAVILRKQLEKRGVTFMTGVSVRCVEKSSDGQNLQITLSNGADEDKVMVVEAEKHLVAKGRKPYTDGLGLDALGIEVKRGRIVTDNRMETCVKGIYAIGDCVNKYMLAHVASREGEVAVENIMGRDVVMDYRTTPGAIYTTPEIATVGISEKEAAEAGININVGRFPLMLNGKSMISGDTSGLVKIIADSASKRVIGMQIVGGPATDMIAEGALAIQMNASPHDIAEAIHAHPTVSESVAEAALNVFGHGIHSPAAASI